MTDIGLTHSSHRFVLSPILNLDSKYEIIDPYTVSRAPIYLVEDEKLVLGRNSLTRIHDAKISRQLATLSVQYVDNDAFTIKSGIPGQVSYRIPKVKVHLNQCGAVHRFCVNGIKVLEEECYIQDGDVIGLYGDMYKYRLDIYDRYDIQMSSQNTVKQESMDESASQHYEGTQGNDMKPTAKRKRTDACESKSNTLWNEEDADTDEDGMNSSSNHTDNLTSLGSKHQAIIATARQHIVDEVTCTVCMEILVKAHTVNPCGHIFCKACVQQIIPLESARGYTTKPCPNCRKPMKSISHLKTMDNLIWNMILRGDIFEEEDDLKEFMRRSGKKWSDLKKEEIECIFGRKDVQVQSLIESDVQVVHEKRMKATAVSAMSMSNDAFFPRFFAFRRGSHVRSPRPSNASNNRSRIRYQGTGSRDDPIVL